MNDSEKRMPLEDLRLTQEYQRLTQKQQLFVAAYVDRNGSADGNYDQVSACRTAYVCRTPEIYRVMSYALMTNPRIIAVLNRHFQTAPIDEFLATVDRAINNKKLSVAQVQALRLRWEILGISTGIPERQPMVGHTKDETKKDRKSKQKEDRPTKPAEKSFYEKEAERL